VLSSLALDMGHAQIEDLYPYPLPDLFAGSQLVLVGRYRAGGPITATLRGLVNGQERAYTFEDLNLRSEGGEPFIARLWATRKIGYLLNELRLRGSNQELIDEIVRLSTTYGIATPYTSFFVPEPVQPPLFGGVPIPTVVVSVEAVKEVSQEVAPAAAQALRAAPAAPAGGAAAVQDSQAREALRSADVAAHNEAAGGLRTALDKTFTYQAGLWVDTAFRSDQPQRQLVLGSDEYFALLDERPEWIAYFAVSPNLIVALGGIAYVITATGAPEATTPLEDLGATPTRPVEPVAVDTAPTPAAAEPIAPPSGQAQLCSAPAFGVGLVLLPGLWVMRRRRTR
jgi:Ca-activated chloride channel family protein